MRLLHRAIGDQGLRVALSGPSLDNVIRNEGP